MIMVNTIIYGVFIKAISLMTILLRLLVDQLAQYMFSYLLYNCYQGNDIVKQILTNKATIKILSIHNNYRMYIVSFHRNIGGHQYIKLP